ncbi:MAG: hypothetical protein O2856_15090 [Planctomycetota bacterium]|nr:hypothetical protein [Planctomycetota bacterium]
MTNAAVATWSVTHGAFLLRKQDGPIFPNYRILQGVTMSLVLMVFPDWSISAAKNAD